MLSISNPFSIPRFLKSRAAAEVDLDPVPVHDVEGSPDKRARTLRHLLKLNHANHSILYNDNRYHNHVPHFLGSAYILGVDENQLQSSFETESSQLEPWHDSPNEISDFDWRDYLGDGRYQRAYIDYFEDQLVVSGYDWKALVHDVLFTGENPLGNNLVAGLGHPLIHLGYAFELDSREVAIEALALSATNYDSLHKYLDNAAFKSSKDRINHPQGSSLLNHLEAIRTDKRFEAGPDLAGKVSIESLLQKFEPTILEYWMGLDLDDPQRCFLELRRAATSILVDSLGESGTKKYDFFFAHLVTTSHAIRILIPLVPPAFHLSLLRQWWLLTVLLYVRQGRPIIEDSRVQKTEIEGKDWTWVIQSALSGPWSRDAHFVKVLRALKNAAEDDEPNDGFQLKAAIRICDEFDDWGGFNDSRDDCVQP